MIKMKTPFCSLPFVAVKLDNEFMKNLLIEALEATLSTVTYVLDGSVWYLEEKGDLFVGHKMLGL